MGAHRKSPQPPPTPRPAERDAQSPRSRGRLWDAIVLGAGASGLFCAMTAAARGKTVLLIDHSPIAGRKLSITGGGKCNVTNRRVSPQDYHGGNPDFCRSALARFTPEHLTALLDEAGIALEEREHGQIFCRRSARDVTRLLVGRCLESGCEFAMEERVRELGRSPDGANGRPFFVRTDRAIHLARKVAVALGGPAWPQVGATGVGHELARAMGHGIVPARPALAGLILPPGQPLAGLAGIAVPATIRVILDDDADGRLGARGKNPVRGKGGRNKNEPPPAARELSLLFTHSGISGPAALQASLYWRPGMRLVLDFLPRLPEGEGLSPLLEAPEARKTLCRNVLKKILPDRLCEALLPDALGAIRCAELGRVQKDALAEACRNHAVSPLKTEGFAKAEVAAGGVSTRQVSSKTMESLLAPGLYFCGEVLDVTGRLGGYNLHWAFASGKTAGEAL